MDKLKLVEWGEKIKTGGAQMGRLVGEKMKEILQSPTIESRIVDEATSEALEEPNWGMNLRICSMINSGEFSGTEIVRALKRKIGSSSGKSGSGSSSSQRLGLDLLEAVAMNCEKVFSEVASEKVLEEMVRVIEDPRTDEGIRDRAWQLICAWGQSEDLEYLSVFRQTYLSLKERRTRLPVEGGNFSSGENTLESHVFQDPPENYPIPDASSQVASAYDYHHLSAEEKNEFLTTSRNTLELLSSILDKDAEPKPIKEDLTVNLLEKCKLAQPAIERIVQSTVDDEALLFEALNLHDQIQAVISKYEELERGLAGSEQLPGSAEAPVIDSTGLVEHSHQSEVDDHLKQENSESRSLLMNT